MTYGIRCVRREGPHPPPGAADPAPVGFWLSAFDPDAHDGRGEVAWSRNPEDAMEFASVGTALTCWRTPSVVHPVRHDGQPNRPLTAFTIAVETLPTRVALRDLQPGQVIYSTGEVVEAVQHMGPLVIVDFVGDTATPPLPANGVTYVR